MAANPFSAFRTPASISSASSSTTSTSKAKIPTTIPTTTTRTATIRVTTRLSPPPAPSRRPRPAKTGRTKKTKKTKQSRFRPCSPLKRKPEQAHCSGFFFSKMRFSLLSLLFLNSQQLNVEDQYRRWRNHRRLSLIAVSQVRRNEHLPLRPNLHLLQRFSPPSDHSIHRKNRRFISFNGTVEFR